MGLGKLGGKLLMLNVEKFGGNIIYFVWNKLGCLSFLFVFFRFGFLVFGWEVEFLIWWLCFLVYGFLYRVMVLISVMM